jgi:hypothetical protein
MRETQLLPIYADAARAVQSDAMTARAMAGTAARTSGGPAITGWRP